MKKNFIILMMIVLACFWTLSFPAQAKLGKELAPPAIQKNLLVVKVFADWCKKCKRIDSTYTTIVEKYEDQVQFIVLDVSNRKKLKIATRHAESLGLSQWFNEYKSITSIVAIISAKDKKVINILFNEPDEAKYHKAITQGLSVVNKL